MPQDSGAINPEDGKTTISPNVRAAALPAAPRLPQEQTVRGVVGLLPVVVSHLREE